MLVDRTTSDAAAQVRAAVNGLWEVDVAALDGVGVADLLEQMESVRRLLDSFDTRVLAAAEDRRLDGAFANASLVDLLVTRLNVDAVEARRRVRRSYELGPRHTLTGEPLEPILPATAKALAAAEISAAHADAVAVYTAMVDGLPTTCDADVAVAEDLLLQASRHQPPKQVQQLGQLLLARLNPDGTEPNDEDNARKRGFSINKNPDGSSTCKWTADAETTAMIEATLDTLAAPQRCRGDQAAGTASSDGDSPAAAALAADDEHDDRTPTQRRHDAMRDVLSRVLRSGDLPVAGGTPTTVVVHVTLDQFGGRLPDVESFHWYGDRDTLSAVKRQITERIGAAREGGAGDEPAAHGGCDGYASTMHGGLLSGWQLRVELCDAEVDVVVKSPEGAVLAFGRSKRLAVRAQRIALAARDGGCCFPGCSRPASWCEAHHVVPWLDGGRTDLENLCLLCSFHHRNFERLGYSVRMNHGVPE